MITREKERRTFSWKSIINSFRNRQRITSRRESDATGGYYADTITTTTFILASVFCVMCASDTLLTLFILNSGGVELNPIMRYFLEIDTTWFISTKITVSLACLIFLVLHERFSLFKIIHVKNILFVITVGYICLILYELIIIFYHTMPL